MSIHVSLEMYSFLYPVLLDNPFQLYLQTFSQMIGLITPIILIGNFHIDIRFFAI